MPDTYTASQSYSYTYADIEKVVRRFTGDIVMIAQSTGAITEATARDYAHDVEALARRDYLKKVDITLLSGSTEVKATQYVVNRTAGDLDMSRPGGVMWPRVSTGHLRIVLTYSDSYTAEAREEMKGRLRISWTPSYADLSHLTLRSTGGRDYASNGWGMQRKDFAA